MTAAERPTGSRSRSGNAGGRAREAVLDGALISIAERGTTRTTMSGIAASARVAKATVYNHFRSKEEIFAALVEREIDRVCVAAAGEPDLEAALFAAASHLGDHPARGGLEALDPRVLMALVAAAPLATGSRTGAAAGLQRYGARDDAAAVDAVLRLLASFLVTPDVEGGRRAVTGVVAGWLAPPVPLRELTGADRP